MNFHSPINKKFPKYSCAHEVKYELAIWPSNFPTLCPTNFSIKELWSHHDKNRMFILTKDILLVSFSRALLMISVLTIVVKFLGEAVGITSLFYSQTYYQYQITEMVLHVSSHRSLKITTGLKIFPLK